MNRSQTPPSVLRPLLAFVSKYCDFADMAVVKAVTSYQFDDRGRPTCGGIAVSQDGAYLVVLGLNPDSTYPRQQRLNLLTPEVTFETWQDEVVMILAHELRHVTQFVLGAFSRDQELEAEVDAETFGATVLEAWKTSQRVTARAA